MHIFLTHWFGFRILSRPPFAQFSWESKPDFRSCEFTASYLLEMFFTIWEKYYYIQIFPNEVSVLIEIFETGVEATPFFVILCRWRKYTSFSAPCSEPHYPTLKLKNTEQKTSASGGTVKSF